MTQFRRLLSLSLLVLLAACGGDDALQVTVMDTAKEPLEGVEIRLVGDNALLATTDARGEASVKLPQKDDTKLRLLHPGRETHRFENAYAVEAADRRLGKKLIRVEIGGAAEPTTATLRVTTLPPGAAISLNGTPSGHTDTVLRDLPAGRMRIALTLEGMHPDTVDMYLVAGENELTRTLRPAAITTASLVVSSSPTGADVYLNGKKTGELTPAVFRDLKPGRHTVKIRKDGFRDYETRVTLQAGKEGAVNSGPLAERSAKPSPPQNVEPAGNTRSTFLVTTRPNYAEVFVDDENVNRNANGSFNITLPEGTHRFRVKNAQGVDVVLQYTVLPNDPHSKLFLRYEEGQVEARK